MNKGFSFTHLCAAGLMVSVAVAPLRAEANTGSAGTSLSSQCSAPSGKDLFLGVFYGLGDQAKLAEALVSKEALEATYDRKSRLTIDQTKRLLEKQRKTLLEAGKKKDAEIVAELVKQLEAAPRGDVLLDDQLPRATKERRTSVAKAVMRLIEAEDAAFFETFRRDMTSGNPAKVDVALRRAMRMNFDKLAIVSGQDPAAGDGKDPGHGVDQDSSVVLWIGIALILLVWIALPLNPDSPTALTHDQSVARLTKSLSC